MLCSIVAVLLLSVIGIITCGVLQSDVQRESPVMLRITTPADLLMNFIFIASPNLPPIVTVELEPAQGIASSRLKVRIVNETHQQQLQVLPKVCHYRHVGANVLAVFNNCSGSEWVCIENSFVSMGNV